MTTKPANLRLSILAALLSLIAVAMLIIGNVTVQATDGCTPSSTYCCYQDSGGRTWGWEAGTCSHDSCSINSRSCTAGTGGQNATYGSTCDC
jgi:hypothetical protein